MKTALVHTVSTIKDFISDWKIKGYTIGFVPTMGALHKGHLALIKNAKKMTDKVIVSIFINPLQFNEKTDFDNYPIDIEHDVMLCENEKVDVIFNPNATTLNIENIKTFIELKGLTNHLCGAKRPEHFEGVCTIITKFFNILQPDYAFFGEKDFQQLAIIKKMIHDLNIPVGIISYPTVREADGLAISSRNKNLTIAERQAATIIYKALYQAKELLLNGEISVKKVKYLITKIIETKSLAKIDYIEIVDTKNLEPVNKINTDVLIAVAAFFGKTRLIDNFVFKFV